jgi:branched-chain amino acid transport system substrate-binding protein
VRTCYTSSQVSHPLGEYAAKKLGYKRVVTIASDYAYGWEVTGGFQQCFEESGGKVIQKIWAPLGFKDFTATFKDLKKDCDAIFLCNVGQSAEIIPKQLREMGYKGPLIGTTASFDESFYPRMGDEIVGAISSSLYSTAIDTPENKNFVKAYKAKFNEDPSYFSEHGYVTAMWIDKALQSIKGDVSDHNKILAALKKVELKAPRGPVKLDAYGTSIDNVYIRKVERKNGKLQNTVVYTYPNVSQFWKYDPETYMKQPSYSKDYPPCKYCQ